MGKTFRSWSDSDSDKRNSRCAKKHSDEKQKRGKSDRAKLKNKSYKDFEDDSL